jgi:hypothetical protein
MMMSATPVGAGDLGVVVTSIRELIAAVQARDLLAGWAALQKLLAEMSKANAPDPAPVFTATEPSRDGCCAALEAVAAQAAAGDGKWVAALLKLLPLLLSLFA